MLHADTLRFSTAGSVDDGKSTLIGRLLYDAQGLMQDQVQGLIGATRKHGHVGAGEALDFSLLTDGLIAEREQGIPSMWHTDISRRPNAASSSPIRPVTSSTHAIW